MALLSVGSPLAKRLLHRSAIKRSHTSTGAASKDAASFGSSKKTGRETGDRFTPEVLPALRMAESVDLESDPEKVELWRAAIKLPMYWVAIVPVMVGAATVYYDVGIVSVFRTVRLVLGAISVIAWLNLSNDVFDHETGADDAKRESIVHLSGNKSFIFAASLVFLASGIAFLGSAIQTVNAPSAALKLGMAIACGYLYQGPPFRLSYQGLGEPLCFVAFGPIATSAFYLVLSAKASVSITCWAASILVGITTTIVLFCSHFHQFDSDKAVNKQSPIVRLGGPHNGLHVLLGALLGLFCLVIGTSAANWLLRLLIPMSAIPAMLAARCFFYGKENLCNLSKLRLLKLYALDLHASFGMAIVLTLILARKLIF